MSAIIDFVKGKILKILAEDGEREKHEKSFKLLKPTGTGTQ